MITIHWFELFATYMLMILWGVILGTKTSADRWIEYEEWKAWKAQEK